MANSEPRMISTAVRLERLELKRVKERTARLFAALEESMDTESSLGFDSFTPSMDIYECKDRVNAILELPGIEAEDIEVSIASDSVFVEGEKKHSGHRSSSTSSHYCCERMYGRFRRRIPLRWAIDVKGITATLKNGNLKIVLPKLADRRGKAIKIPVVSEEKD